MAYKQDYDKILTRLIEILSRLNDGEALSVTELAKEFNVSTRTVQRDFNERLCPKFPIYKDKKQWRMQKGFKLEKSSDIEEIVVLDIMEKLIEEAGSTFALKAEKLLSKLKNDTPNPFYAKLDMEDIGDKLKEVQQLEEAIKNRQQIQCLYDFEKFTIPIDLKPLKIANYEGFWYLIALDARNDELKKYYFKNIRQITIKEETFTTDAKLDELLEKSISVWFAKDVEPYRVTLELSEEIVKYFKRKPLSKTQRVEEMREDGSMVISVEVTNDMEIIPVVKYWMPEMRILSPSRIEEQIKKDIECYLDQTQIK
jgi:predicted DNA-binding transcriptional regulator YafY